jgi:hypothetical protein
VRKKGGGSVNNLCVPKGQLGLIAEHRHGSIGDMVITVGCILDDSKALEG